MPEWKNVKVPLAYPITIGEGPAAKTITEIVMREPDAGAVERIQASGALSTEDGKDKEMTIAQIIVCVSALSGNTEDTIRKLHYRDIKAAGELLGPLFSGLEDAPDEPSTNSTS